MKRFNGKAIYNPSGKAGEYSQWACNFFVGCSNGCEYCYCKKGILAGVMGQDAPQLKKCFRDEDHALEVFEREMMQNIDALREHGLFFTFTSDPMLDLTMDMTIFAAEKCLSLNIPVQILTKNAENPEFCFLGGALGPHQKARWFKQHHDKIAVGFTLTGHDELEPHASPNAERVAVMRELHDAGFKTFASIEPIVDLASSWSMIEATLGFCDLYKIGLMTGGSKPDKDDLFHFIGRVTKQAEEYGAKVYWKESIRRCFDYLDYEKTPGVDSSYNLFK